MANALKVKLKTLTRLILPTLILVLLIASAAKVRDSCFDALILCGRLIVPSLFPFFVLSAFMTRLGLPGTLGRLLAPFFSPLYGISPAGASALPIGLLGGYPAGAAYIADMEQSGSISAAEAERLLAFCNNSGPSFIIGVMGLSVFGSVRIGLRLYAVHIFAALISGLFFRSRDYTRNVQPHRLDDINTAQALVQSITQAASSIINVCAFVIFFSVLMSILDAGDFFSNVCLFLSKLTGADLNFIRALLTGILELGNGAASMQQLPASPATLALAAGLLSWGGLSVHFQSLAVLSKSNIKGTLHLAGRLISALTASVLMLLISLF